ncbi:DnaD domain protein, partial [Neobacillus drentensis]|uniref:DnaD domain protein n=1 Tax=Neobacillus drentensis TaxID=220684 RepID=UPI002FFFF8B7
EVEDLSLIRYVLEPIQKQEIRSLYESFCKQEEMFFSDEIIDQVENDTYLEPPYGMSDDTLTHRYTSGGQKEEEKEKEKEKQQQESFNPYVEKNPDIENPLQSNQIEVQEIVEFWDNNGFGFSNINAKQQLLAWLEDSRFLQPKEVILKAMNIACANNKRRLSYVVGILKNWENDSLLTVEEIDSYHENQKPLPKDKQPAMSNGRQIPSGFKLDLTAGEE